jgi:hypothetical protein
MSSRQHPPRRTMPGIFLLLGGVPPKRTELPWMDFDVYELLDQCKSRFPSLADRYVDLWFCPQEFLACIQHNNSSQRIFIHSVLNRPDVPIEVIEFIFVHELIHLIVPPREIEGRLKIHPPEFWDMEREMADDRMLVWSWIILNLSRLYRKDEERETLIVKRSWKRIAPSTYPTLAFIRQSLPKLATIPTEAEGLL